MDGSEPFPALGSSPRRPRRGRPPGRRFECTYTGCGRFYSRAEHLQRHKLNHTPRELYVCPVAGCTLSFVRKDLYVRHKVRHEQQAQLPDSEQQGSTLSTTDQLALDSAEQGVPGGSSDPSCFGFSTLPPGPYSGTSVGRSHQESPSNSLHLDSAIQRQTANDARVRLSADDTDHSTISLGPRSDLSSVGLEANLVSPPASSTEEFTAWLFDSQLANQCQPNFSDLGLDAGYYSDDFHDFQVAYPGQVAAFQNEPNSQLSQLPSSGAAGGSATPPTAKTKLLSRKQWQHLITLILEKLTNNDNRSNQVLQGDFDDEQHPLSLVRIQSYLDSYWKFFHEYLPILHEPTFSPENNHSYLLLAVLIIGISMLDRQPGFRGPGPDFTNHIAWNLRGHVLMHVDASPPGRLWVFQTLLLLEVHDKLLSTAALHERALVFFPTTLNLMRRSSTLFGRQVSKSNKPSTVPQNEASEPKQDLTVGFFAPQRLSTPPPELWWEHWILQEAIRRAAFTAFLLDASHAVMFGHTQTLVFYEIHLYLPCDRMLWASKSPSEVGAIESSLYAHGIKPPSFLEGLRKMINCQTCHTNAFGRLVLLAGLLSIISHMQQRDLLVNTLACDPGSTAPGKWQPRLIKALEWWRKDYEDHISYLRGAVLDWQKLSLSEDNRKGQGDDLALGFILYRLGAINISITIPELSVFAGARIMLGRPVSPFEKRMVKDKISRWAASTDAVHAVFHALHLIKSILFSVTVQDRDYGGQPGGSESPGGGLHYEASFDKLPNRSWALYFAAMVVWAYGFHCDGPLDPFPHELHYPPDTTLYPDPSNPDQPSEHDTGNEPAQLLIAMSAQGRTEPRTTPHTLRSHRSQDLQAYLDYMLPPSITSPEELNKHLQALSCGRNKVLGLLAETDRALDGSNWELLDEARCRLKSAALLLRKV
ncbi:hypothetical protein GQ53DRAFT_874278 [Thozetella sp. PMI_491]|nr:hypothetical protein GQ53DRAFT_874278 [Thozetella sp. PMI_491]